METLRIILINLAAALSVLVIYTIFSVDTNLAVVGAGSPASEMSCDSQELSEFGPRSAVILGKKN